MIAISDVKAALGITGEYLDNTITPYFDEVIDFIKDAGVKEKKITVGLVARGISDLWNYGAADGKLSEYFVQRVTQLSYKN